MRRQFSANRSGVLRAAALVAGVTLALSACGGGGGSEGGGQKQTGSAYADFACLRGDPSDGLPGVAGVGELRSGRRVEPFAADEVADADKPPILRAYLEAWAWEVGRFFDGLDKNATTEELRTAAPGFPVFRIA